MSKEALQQRWYQLFATHDHVKLENTFDQLCTQYSQTHRYYHTLQHVTSLLSHLQTVEHLINDHFCVETAIWFHDMVYDPKRDDNEARSAQSAVRFLKAIDIPKEMIEKVKHLILLTKHPSTPQTKDEKYLIDMDLSILGVDTSYYAQYEKWIRKEYQHVSDIDYKKGRKKVLDSFLSMAQIYQTEYFYERLEGKARENVSNAMISLCLDISSVS